MKFGTLQNVLGEDLVSVWAVAARLGFDGVEVDWRSPAESEVGGALSPPNRSQIVEAARAAGVEISSVAAHFLNGGGIASPDEAERERAIQNVRDGLQLCHDLGATALLVPFFGPAEAQTQGEEGLNRLVQSLQVLADDAQRLQVIIAIEHTLRGNVAARVLDAVGSPYVGDYWDMANCLSIGYDALTEIEELQHHIARVHAKEFKGSARENGQSGVYPNLNPVPLGQGDVPIREVLSALKKSGYNGYVTLETGAFGDKHESAAAALKTLKSLYASL